MRKHTTRLILSYVDPDERDRQYMLTNIDERDGVRKRASRAFLRIPPREPAGGRRDGGSWLVQGDSAAGDAPREVAAIRARY